MNSSYKEDDIIKHKDIFAYLDRKTSTFVQNYIEEYLINIENDRCYFLDDLVFDIFFELASSDSPMKGVFDLKRFKEDIRTYIMREAEKFSVKYLYVVK